MRKINQRMGNKDKLFELCHIDKENFCDFNSYIPFLMIRLWKQPKIIARILEHTNINVIKEHLAPLFANNFYENILSSYYIEDNLIYVLTLLIKSEISKLNNINQINNFLDNTPCGFMLGELRKKIDVQSYFKTIIQNELENLEFNNSKVKINFDPDKISNYHEMEYSYKKDGDANSGDESIEEQREQDFSQKNFIINMDKDFLIKLIEENKNDKNLCYYLHSKLSLCEKKDKIFENEKLINSFSKHKEPDAIRILYQKNFMIVINFIAQIIKNILSNFHLVPYPIKCLCRIISETISIKFPKIDFHDKCAFIAKFFFGKLLLPILQNPSIEVFINTYISENTLQNLKEISIIFEKFVSISLYTTNEFEFNYTPFNWYFVKNITHLFTIFEKLVKIRLPSFIENLVYNKLSPDYEYDYFKENPDEIINFLSILFNLEQIKALIKTMYDHQKEIFINEKEIKIGKKIEELFLQQNKGLFDNIISNEKNIRKDPNFNKEKIKIKEKNKKGKNGNISENKLLPKIQYFLVTFLFFNNKYEKLSKIKPKIHFSIEEIYFSDDKESIMKNNIIRAKNYFFNLLYNCPRLTKTYFNEGTTENTEKILTELNMLMKSPNFVMDDSIRYEWDIKSLLEYLKKLPDYLTNNDYEVLYKEMENDINNSIKGLDFYSLGFIIDKLRLASKSKIYYRQSLEHLEDLESNELLRNIIKEKFIPVDIKFEYDSKNNIFKILPSKFKEKERNNENKKRKYEKSNGVKLCCTIEHFTRKFPNLVKHQEFEKANIFEIEGVLNIPKNIFYYMEIIRNSIRNEIDFIIIIEKKFGEEEEENKEKEEEKYLNFLMDKIFDYIMEKLYDKIYPNEPLEVDNKIFKQTKMLSWTKTNHLLNIKREFVFGNFEKDILENFKLMDLNKSPRKKLKFIEEIFKSIEFLLQSNGFRIIAVDEYTPVLQYALIKAQPLRIFSNVKFVELFFRDKVKNNYLRLLQPLCIYIQSIKYSDLNNVTQEEFMEKCKQEIKENEL